MKRIKYFLFFAMLLACMTVKGQEFNYAHDECREMRQIVCSEPVKGLRFNYAYDGSVLVYRVLDEAAKTCEVFGVDNVTDIVNIPLTAVYEDYSGGTTVTKVSYTVTGIGKQAFRWVNYGITNITIPNTVTSIGDEAFGYVFRAL